MKLNHLNLSVTDVPAAQAFLEKYFGMQHGGGNRNIAFVTDANGMLLNLTDMNVGRETEVRYPATFHIGFMQDSEDRVNEINARLKGDGYDVPRPRRLVGGPQCVCSPRDAATF